VVAEGVGALGGEKKQEKRHLLPNVCLLYG